jgi:GNAT superfamily N-acetyltransferase
MEHEVKVRTGTPEEVNEIMEIAMEATEENGFLQPNPLKLLADIWPALNLDNGIMGVIGNPGERIEGVVLLKMGTLWYSDIVTLEEKAVFVRPEFRSAKGGRARKLCEFSKQVADELGLTLVIGVLSSHRTQGKIKMYERLFGEPSGAYFLYGGRTGEWKKVTQAEEAA